MEEKQLNSEESLELITRMIRQERSRVERNAAQPFLVMGYPVSYTHLDVYKRQEVTVSMMTDYLEEQEKMVWMLCAYADGKPSGECGK